MSTYYSLAVFDVITFKPYMDILGLTEKWCAFLRRLFAHLIQVNHTDEESLVNKLQAFSGARDKILMCYRRRPGWVRTVSVIVAEYLLENMPSNT